MRISDWSSDVCSSDLDQTITRLAETSVQLDHFEVVAQAQVPLLDFAFATSASYGTNFFTTCRYQTTFLVELTKTTSVTLDLVISQRSTDGAVCVTNTGRDAFDVRIVFAVYVKIGRAHV